MYNHDEVRVKARQLDIAERIRIKLQLQCKNFAKYNIPSRELDAANALIKAIRSGEKLYMQQIIALSKSSPVYKFVKNTLGLGPSTFYVLGLTHPLTQFHNPTAVWRYFGLHVVDGEAAKLRKGMPRGVGFNRRLKSHAIMRLARPCVYHRRSPYRAVYEARRAWTNLTHPEWTDKHKHNDALRIVAKAILRDLWCVANGKQPRVQHGNSNLARTDAEAASG